MAPRTEFVPMTANGNREGRQVVAVPNPVRETDEKACIIWETRCTGRALVTIYDATGSLV